MGKFLEAEKPLQARFKATVPYFSPLAREEGIYKNHPYPFCLPREHAEENLYPGIRQSAVEYFTQHEIKWHDGQDGNPSNHMCDSQVCCVNFLFPFASQPDALAELLLRLYPSLHKMLTIEADQHVAFEWIGAENYLCEKISRNGKRTRGANFTSADGAVMFEHTDGKQQIVLIEWKYTESYSSTPLHKAKSGTDRTEIYRHLYDSPDCPLEKGVLPDFDDLFYEPFYQLMRQQFLAHEMEKASELGADIVSLLHIAPAHNLDFKRVTSPGLVRLGDTATGVWNGLVQEPDRFCSVSTEELFGNISVEKHQDLLSWYKYITDRYTWVKHEGVLPSLHIT